MEAALELIHVKQRANIQVAGTMEQIGLRRLRIAGIAPHNVL